MTSSSPNTPADATPQVQPDADPTAVSGGIPAHEPSEADLQSAADTSTPTDEVPETAAESGDGDPGGSGTSADSTDSTGSAGDGTAAGTAAGGGDDRPSPFSSPADLQTAGIRDADEHLAESEDATAQAREAAQQLRGSELPETTGEGTDLPAAPDAETTPPQPE